MEEHCWHQLLQHFADTDPEAVCCNCGALRFADEKGGVTFKTRDPAHGPHIAASVEAGEKEPTCATALGGKAG